MALAASGAGAKGFAVPTGVVAGGDVLHVADSGNHRVVMLTLDGRYLTDWTIPSPPKTIYSPEQVAVSPGRKPRLRDGLRGQPRDRSGGSKMADREVTQNRDAPVEKSRRRGRQYRAASPVSFLSSLRSELSSAARCRRFWFSWASARRWPRSSRRSRSWSRSRVTRSGCSVSRAPSSPAISSMSFPWRRGSGRALSPVRSTIRAAARRRG
jgi:hypothetical protein